MSSSSQVLLILGFILSICHLSSCQDYRRFRDNHVVIGHMQISCAQIESERNMSDQHGGCKESNTFIHAENVKTITRICKGKTEHMDRVLSKHTFHVTDCVLDQDSLFPNCAFHQTEEKRQICVKCVRSFPILLYSPEEHASCKPEL
ncbi:sialic acid-binding lectin-like [Pelobates cultripes]|uniref:Sialic acid-binding lectin-like n=1 Tax=Pelobates cultripes TaxID=61616 RepID=A0AAD1SYQ9_PELCU|nr:sialic acid-binding lectin-like [Pelobates cultripes]